MQGQLQGKQREAAVTAALSKLMLDLPLSMTASRTMQGGLFCDDFICLIFISHLLPRPVFSFKPLSLAHLPFLFTAGLLCLFSHLLVGPIFFPPSLTLSFCLCHHPCLEFPDAHTSMLHVTRSAFLIFPYT